MNTGARQGDERGKGIPRSEAERRTRHEELFPGTPLPPRGTGLVSGVLEDSTSKIWAGILTGVGLGFGLFIVRKVIKAKQ